MAILTRYLFRELLLPFTLSVAVLLFLLITQQAVRLVDLMVNRGVDLGVLAKIFMALLPAFFVVTLPIAVLMATIGAFNRLAADHEVIALRSLGVPMQRLVWPAAAFSAALCVLAYGLSLFGEPWAGRSFRSLTADLLKRQATVAVVEGAFSDALEGMTLYVESVPGGNQLQGVMIIDQRDTGPPLLILAERGRFLNTEDGAFGLRLERGSMQRSLSEPGEEEDLFQQIRFENYELKLDSERLRGALASSDRSPSLTDLQARAEKETRTAGKMTLATQQELLAAHKDRAFPLATFWLGILGVPLGISTRRAGRMGAFGFGLLAVGGYYLVLLGADSLAVHTSMPPLPAAWLPNLALALVAVALVLRMDGSGRSG